MNKSNDVKRMEEDLYGWMDEKKRVKNSTPKPMNEKREKASDILSRRIEERKNKTEEE